MTTNQLFDSNILNSIDLIHNVCIVMGSTKSPQEVLDHALDNEQIIRVELVTVDDAKAKLETILKLYQYIPKKSHQDVPIYPHISISLRDSDFQDMKSIIFDLMKLPTIDNFEISEYNDIDFGLVRICTFEFDNHLEGLKGLYLEGNFSNDDLRLLDCRNFQKLETLELDLSSDECLFLKLDNISNLTELSITGKDIVSLNIRCSFKKLEYLRITGTSLRSLRSLTEATFRSLDVPTLFELSLNDNGLDTFTEILDILNELDLVSNLRCYGNPFADLGEILDFKRLAIVDKINGKYLDFRIKAPPRYKIRNIIRTIPRK